ncbi:amidase [Kutzneria sp. CA-103260]|uniref:amidase n=1 Tax=Kutzneria sp. CA-103260 TaxID=2802641 RepID=UPI001BA6463B|nr:amidase [Kutzneria sp. CA-103260]
MAASVAGSPVGASAAPTLDAVLDAATIPDLQAQMAKGDLTAVGLAEAYLRRIRELEPKVRSILFLDPTALSQAEASDQRRRGGHGLGPLDGIPVLLKDNIDTKDLPTTAGSRALLAQKPTRDAELVRRLRAAGAVVLGKTNLSEWANFRSTKSTSGWSGVGGQTNNPYVLDRNPCGSSSGSAAAVAASLAQVAIGTETDGSIVCPGGANGIVGIKPTLGVVSGDGIVPISHLQDTAGPFGRHVVDAAITLSVLSGKDYTPHSTSLRGKRIGVWAMAGSDAGVDKVMQDTVATLKKAGAILVDVAPANQDTIGDNETPALLAEFKHDLNAYLATRPGVPRTLDDLIAFDQRDPVELSKFGQELFEQAQAAPPITDPTYLQQRATATELARHSIDDLIAADHLDAIIAPTNGPAWVTDYASGDAFELGSSTPAAVAGYPDITVPAGFAGALPIGVSFMAGRNSDARLIALAAAFERISQARRDRRSNFRIDTERREQGVRHFRPRIVNPISECFDTGIVFLPGRDGVI